MGSLLYEDGVYVNSGTALDIESSMLVFNGGGPGIDCGWDGTATVSMNCSLLYGNSSDCLVDQIGINGNLSADPLFCFMTEGDFSLRPESPMVTNPGCQPEAGWPTGCGPVVNRDRQAKK